MNQPNYKNLGIIVLHFEIKLFNFITESNKRARKKPVISFEILKKKIWLHSVIVPFFRTQIKNQRHRIVDTYIMIAT
jgi:hypothetical protein